MSTISPRPPDISRDHCPACRIARELTEHRDGTAGDWSIRRATLNFAVIISQRACPNWTGDAA